ncbi:MAG TPA: protein kinase [Candidatus Polarisedimenticolaceae bacterium]
MISGRNVPTGQLAGTSVANYKVLEPVGSGGMGEVYRGWDDKLGRPVAIKVLHPALAAEERARQRFLRETRLACRVVHPYVATVFDVLEKDERLFLVMEYIEGRRLDDVVDEDDPPAREVARLGLEIAEALAAIHGSGLVHRDLKPGNVMVTPAGHVKVMDFGVAYPLRPATHVPTPEGGTPIAEPTLTQEGHGVGTVSYMSPEQIRGGPPDGRSDLFSLGIVLYEALARQHPFMRGSPLATASAILNEAPGSGSDEPRTLTESGALRKVVFRLLEKSPALRYQTAGEVMADLRAAIDGRPLVTRSPRAVRAARIATVLVGVAAAAAGGAWWWSHRPPSEPAAPSRPVLAVLPFEDRTGDADASERGAVLASLVGASLGELEWARPCDEQRAREIHEAVRRANPAGAGGEAIVRLADARWVVDGELYREGGSYEGVLRILDVASKGPAVSHRISAASLAALADVATARVLASLAPKDSADNPAGGETVYRDEAILLAARARRLSREGRLGEAIAAAERAVTIDARYAQAWIELAEARQDAGYGTPALEAAGTAVRLASSAAPPLPSRTTLEIRAIARRVEGDVAKEIEARRAVVDEAPDDPTAHRTLADALRGAGRLQEALPEAERSVALDLLDPRAHTALGAVLSELGRHERAAAAIASADRLFEELGSVPGRAAVATQRGVDAFERGQHDEAIVAFEAAREGYERAGLHVLAAMASKKSGDVELARSHLRQAEERYAKALPVFRQSGNVRRVVDTLDTWGGKVYLQGDVERGERLLREALAAGAELQNPRATLFVKAKLASVLMYTQRIGEGAALAREVLDTARRLGRADVELRALNMLADAAQQQGRLTEALELYSDAAEAAKSRAGQEAGLAALRTDVAAILLAHGRVGEALTSVDEALAIADAKNLRLRRGYALRLRALIRARLGAFDDAAGDLRAATTLASDPQGPLGDLLPRLDLTRGVVAALGGDWDEAERRARTARSAASGRDVVGLEVPATTLLCETLTARGRLDEAVALGNAAVAHAKATAVERVAARVAYARALLAAGRTAEAGNEAARAWDEARRQQTPLAAAEAAAVLLTIPDPPYDRALVREEARRLLAAYLESAPEKFRSSMNGLESIRRLREALRGGSPVAAIRGVPNPARRTS